MSNDLIINSTKHEERVCLVEDGKLIEFNLERKQYRSLVGSIYRGRILKVVPGIQSCFVDIGLDKAAFLYVSDASDILSDLDFTSFNDLAPIEDRRKNKQNIEEIFKDGMEILVQISKDSFGTKGVRVTNHVSLPGRYIVYFPTINTIGVSKKITSELERERLRNIVKKLNIKGGIVIRTAAEGVSFDEIKTDLKYLFGQWKTILKDETRAPALVYQDLNLALRSVRDLINYNVNRILVDSYPVYKNIYAFLKKYSKQYLNRLFFYKDKKPIFTAFNLEHEIEKILNKKIWLRSGGYLTIDQTEALVAIDINTGKYVGKKDFEETILKINLEAAREIPIQLRVRNLSGIIIVDFIDMRSDENREKVYNCLLEGLVKDKNRVAATKIGEFGLVAMTRKRTSQPINRILMDSCPRCHGTGYEKSIETVMLRILEKLRLEISSQIKNDFDAIILYVSEEIADGFVKRKEFLDEIKKTYKKDIIIEAKETYSREKFEIKLK
jgi:ribonuclease G